MKRERRRTARAARCVLDSGGLTALIGRSQRARAWFRWIVEQDGPIVVPTPVLVETTTGDGARDAEVNRILSVLASIEGAFVQPDEKIARAAGRLRHRAKADDGIDALVAATAAVAGTPCVLLTSDPDDMRRLLVNDPDVNVVDV
jgi:predicted nucleic acid-binding protein